MRAKFENQGTSVVDPYKHKERFETWDGSLPGVNNADADLIREYIQDMRDGVNVGGKKGKRSTIRLNTIRSRMAVLARLTQTHAKKDLVNVTGDELVRIFSHMRDGTIPREDGKPYKSVADYTISYKAFWHWYMKRQYKKKETVMDKTQDFDTSQHKPKFHYLTHEQVKRLAENAKPYYRMLIWFLYDAGCRAPTEMMNVRASDLSKRPDGIFELQIRDETSKTFGRKIKLLLCSPMLESYLRNESITGDSYIFTISPGKTNKYLQRLGHRVLGIGKARMITSPYTAKKENGERVRVKQRQTVVSDGLTMYDFRHSSACYWLPKYKSESALKYRFGWKNSDMIHYYTELLGMKDTITQDDLVDSEEKTRLQTQLEAQRKQIALMEEQMQSQQSEMYRLFMELKKERVEDIEAARDIQRRRRDAEK